MPEDTGCTSLIVGHYQGIVEIVAWIPSTKVALPPTTIDVNDLSSKLLGLQASVITQQINTPLQSVTEPPAATNYVLQFSTAQGARQKCKSEGGDLPSLDTEEERTDLFKYGLSGPRLMMAIKTFSKSPGALWSETFSMRAMNC